MRPREDGDLFEYAPARRATPTAVKKCKSAPMEPRNCISANGLWRECDNRELWRNSERLTPPKLDHDGEASSVSWFAVARNSREEDKLLRQEEC